MRKAVLVYLGALILIMTSSVLLADDASKTSQTKKYDLGKIFVTQSRLEQSSKDSTANVSVVDDNYIDTTGAEGVYQALQGLPSVEIFEYGSMGSAKTIHTRGASESQVIVLIDGRPTNTPRDGTTDFNKISLINVDRIEVIRGPASSIYGANAMGGVINIITKTGKDADKDIIEAKYGSWNTETIDVLTHGKEKEFDYLFSGGWQKSNGFRENSDYKAYEASSVLGFDINEQNRVKFYSGYWNSKLGVPGQITDEDLDDRQNAWNDYFDLTWDGKLWQDTNILFKAYNTIDRLDFIESTSPTYDVAAHVTTVSGTTLQLSQWWFDVFRTTFGTDMQDNKINSSSNGKHAYNVKAGYLETEIKPVESLSIRGGARLDDYSNFGNKVSPSTSFSWWASDILKFHGLWGESFRAPTFNDLYWPREDWGIWGGVEGNPNLRPEKAKSYEFGFAACFIDKIDTDVTYFNNKFKDLIAWQSDENWWYRPSNVNNALIQGIEFNTDYTVAKNLKLNFNYTYLDAKDTITDKWITYRPKNTYKGSIYYGFTDKLSFYIDGRYVTKRFTETTNASFLKSYFVSDANMAYKLNKSTEFTLTLDNIFDKDYQEVYNYPMPGTSYLLGVKLTF